MQNALFQHGPEYLIEAACLGLFMVAASVFGVVLAPVGQPLLQRALMGAAMGGTAIALIYSPWGKRSGAHLNPAVTLTFLRLGKIKPRDAAFYILAQFTGACAGMLLAATLLRDRLASPAVNYVATLPGPSGAGPAFLAELVISFVLMLVVLHVSNSSLAPFTGWFAGALVALYITMEAPLSGMSLNPARTFGSALVGNIWTSIWIYFMAPPVGMLLAAQVFQRRSLACAKLVHDSAYRCIFCGHNPPREATQPKTKMEVVS